MTSYLPFSLTSPSPTSSPSSHSDDPHLQVIVTPSASAFYAGDTFSATITLRNTLPPPPTPTATPASARSGSGSSNGTTYTHSRPPASSEALSSALSQPHPPTASPSSSTLTTHPSPLSLSGRRNQVGLSITSTPRDADAGPSKPRPLSLASPVPKELGTLYSPGANPSFRAGWPAEQLSPIRSPGWRRKEGVGASGGKEQGHTRRTRSLALGKTMSPQEMVWALGGQTPPPPLPRRPNGSGIPSSHPHSRKLSIASSVLSPPPSEPLSLSPSPLHSIPERSVSLNSPEPNAYRDARGGANGGGHDDSRSSSRGAMSYPSRSSPSASGPASTNQSTTDFTDDAEIEVASILSNSTTAGRRRTSPSPLGPRRSPSISPDPLLSPLPYQPQSVSTPMHSRTPSYHNAYGAHLTPGPPGSASSTLPPPTHPSLRHTGSRPHYGTTKILWAHTRLVAHFTPSNTYIPPDPLLPLRARMLHQPVGSGALVASPQGSASSTGSNDGRSASGGRWQLSFGTGAIGGGQQPSLTGSLLGLAKDLVYGGGGGTLEEERKRVWNMKDLPVLETTRSLLGIDMDLKEGESRQFVYTFQLPSTLPPAYRGKAVRFSYNLIVSINVALPGGANRQRSRDITIPIRVWSNVSLSNPLRTYDVLQPVIQTTEQGRVVDAPQSDIADSTLLSAAGVKGSPDASLGAGSKRHKVASQDTLVSLESYARHLLDTLEPEEEEDPRPTRDAAQTGRAGTESPPSRPRSRAVPASPSRSTTFTRTLSPPLPVSSPVLEPTPTLAVPIQLQGAAAEGKTVRKPSPEAEGKGKNGGEVSNGEEKEVKPSGRAPQVFVEGDDELVNGADEPGSGEAVEILSRHSPKMSYDIAKDGDIVAVLTLVKTTYRLGETVLGIVTFNQPLATRRVLRLSAFLETHELIPEALLPPSASSSGRARQPHLARLHAEHCASYMAQTSRVAFSLDIPSDATPAFRMRAGDEGADGGLEWRVKLSFLVVTDHTGHAGARRHHHDNEGRSNGKDGASGRNTALTGLTNVVPVPSHDHDNHTYVATTTLAPVVRPRDARGGSGKDHKGSGHGEASASSGGAAAWEEARTETVECEIPIQVLAGNTAFVVRPTAMVV